MTARSKIYLLVLLLVLGVATTRCTAVTQSTPVTWKNDTVYTAAYQITCSYNTCEVYFTSTIEELSSYIGLARLIDTAPYGSTINIHLAGNGGDSSAVFFLANAIVSSKAQINTIVEGPVQSCHAFLAMLGNKIVIRPYSYFMFHSLAVELPDHTNIMLNKVCPMFAGKLDRGQDAVKKCEDDMKQTDGIMETLKRQYMYKYLTIKEIYQINHGYNVYVTGVEMQRRINNER